MKLTFRGYHVYGVERIVNLVELISLQQRMFFFGGPAGISLLLMHNLWNCPVPRRQETSRTPNFSRVRQFWCLEFCPKNSGAVAWNGLDTQVFLDRLSWFWGEFGWDGGVVFLMFFFWGDIQENERLVMLWCPCFFETPVLGRADLSMNASNNIYGKIVKHEETEHVFCSCHSVSTVLDFRFFWVIIGIISNVQPGFLVEKGFTIWFNVGLLHWFNGKSIFNWSALLLVRLPSRELTYPPKMAFWRWFSFSQGGIC